jgi:hypothetical protein
MPITIGKNDGATILTVNNFNNLIIDSTTPIDNFSDIVGDEETAVLFKSAGPMMTISFEYVLVDEASTVVSGTGGTVTTARGQMKYLYDTLMSSGSDAFSDDYYIILEFSTTALDSGTATAGGASTLTDSGKSWTVNGYAGQVVKLTGGTGSGQVRNITSNTATQLTVTEAWATNPDATTTYTIVDGFARKGGITRLTCQMASDSPLTFRGTVGFIVGDVIA